VWAVKMVCRLVSLQGRCHQQVQQVLQQQQQERMELLHLQLWMQQQQQQQQLERAGLRWLHPQLG
jgi:hypothetical protein